MIACNAHNLLFYSSLENHRSLMRTVSISGIVNGDTLKRMGIIPASFHSKLESLPKLRKRDSCLTGNDCALTYWLGVGSYGVLKELVRNFQRNWVHPAVPVAVPVADKPTVNNKVEADDQWGKEDIDEIEGNSHFCFCCVFNLLTSDCYS